jgi:hypothetical protein
MTLHCIVLPHSRVHVGASATLTSSGPSRMFVPCRLCLCLGCVRCFAAGNAVSMSFAYLDSPCLLRKVLLGAAAAQLG